MDKFKRFGVSILSLGLVLALNPVTTFAAEPETSVVTSESIAYQHHYWNNNLGFNIFDKLSFFIKIPSFFLKSSAIDNREKGVIK